jgi:hypothetical protein
MSNHYPDYSSFTPSEKYHLIHRLWQTLEQTPLTQDKKGLSYLPEKQLLEIAGQQLQLTPPSAGQTGYGWYNKVFQPVLQPALFAAGLNPQTSLHQRIDQPESESGHIHQRQVEQGPVKISAAKAINVDATHLVVDDERLIYLHFYGGRTAVKANWAALKQGKRQWLYRSEVKLAAEEHFLLEGKLKCGWDERVLLHKQASVELDHLPANDQVFYLLQPPAERHMPQMFMRQMSQHCPIPLLPTWQDYLWLTGCYAGLIKPLNFRCVGWMAWRVNVSYEAWSDLVRLGLQDGLLVLE